MILPWIKNYEIEFRRVYIIERRKQRKLDIYKLSLVWDHTRAVCYLRSHWQKWRAMSSPSASTKCPRDISWGTERDIYSIIYFLMCQWSKCNFKYTMFNQSVGCQSVNPRCFVFPSDYFLFNSSEIIVFMINAL